MNDALGQDAEIALIRGLTHHLIAKSFVDIGAERGSFAQAMFSCGLSGAMFDPLPKHFKGLEEMARIGGGRVFPWAIAEADDVRQFFVATDAHGVELDHFHSLERLDSDPRFQHGQVFEVVCRSLSSLTADGTLSKTLGILKIDTEGRDLAVLQGMGILRPELVVCEFFTTGLNDGWHAAEPSLAIAHMRGLGYARYVAFKRVEGFEQCVMGPCGFLPRQWGNLFFFSDDLFMRAESTVTTFLSGCEISLVEHWTQIAEDRVAKERVIRELSEQRSVPMASQKGSMVGTGRAPERSAALGGLPQCVVSAVTARKRRGHASVAIDVGAHHGEFSRSIISGLDIDTVHAFEPHADNFRKLQTLSLDHPQIVTSGSAVGEHDGFVWFGCNADDATGSILSYADSASATPPSGRWQVPMVSLDAFCRDFADEGRDIRLIKIDTQGYDLEVLKGCEQTLLQHEPVVFLEFIYCPLYVDQATPLAIPRRDGEHALQLPQRRLDAPGFEAGTDDFGVTVAAKGEPFSLQFAAQRVVIVDLAIEHNGEAPTRRPHGLMARRRQVENRQAAESQRDPGVTIRPFAGVVWPAMAYRVGHRADLSE